MPSVPFIIIKTQSKNVIPFISQLLSRTKATPHSRKIQRIRASRRMRSGKFSQLEVFFKKYYSVQKNLYAKWCRCRFFFRNRKPHVYMCELQPNVATTNAWTDEANSPAEKSHHLQNSFRCHKHVPISFLRTKKAETKQNNNPLPYRVTGAEELSTQISVRRYEFLHNKHLE